MKKLLLISLIVLLITALISVFAACELNGEEKSDTENQQSTTGDPESADSEDSTDTKPVVKYIDAALGNGTAFYLAEEGDLYCAGDNTNSMLGFDSEEKIVRTPQKLPLNKKITRVSACLNMCAVLTIDNEVYVFGVDPIHEDNYAEDEYRGEIHYLKSPTKIDTAAITDIIVDMQLNGLTILFLTDAGKVYGYGDNTLKQISPDDIQIYESAVEISLPKKVVKIGNAAASWFLTEDGDLYSIGDINGGAFGDAEYDLTLHAEDVKDFSCGVLNTYYVNTADEFYARGQNYRGECGSGLSDSIIKSFKKVQTTGIPSILPNGSMFFAAFFDTDNKVNVWGDNTHGTLGLPEKRNYLIPQVLDTYSANNTKKFVCGALCFLIVTEDGEVFGTGNAFGELGIHNVDDDNVPIPFPVVWE